MEILNYIDDYVSDGELTGMILILTLLFGLIPIITAIKTQTEINKTKTKKGITKTVYTKSGKWYWTLFVIIILLGLWKIHKDNKTQATINNAQNELSNTINSMNRGMDTLKKQGEDRAERDSLIFDKILANLNKNGIGLDKDLNVIRGGQLTISNSTFSGAGRDNIHIENNMGTKKK